MKYRPGAVAGVDLGLKVDPAFGLKITQDGSIVIGARQHVDVFSPGSKVPTRSFPTIPTFDITLSRDETKLYVASSARQGVGVAEYDFGTGALLGTITNGLSEPDGVAYDPAPSL